MGALVLKSRRQERSNFVAKDPVAEVIATTGLEGGRMKGTLIIFLVLFGTTCTVFATAGEITLGTPVVSCEVIRLLEPKQVERKDLSSERCQRMENWVKDHRMGWQGMITEAAIPPEPVELAIDLKHADSEITHISIVRLVNDRHYLLKTGPGKWAYESLLGVSKSWAALRPMSDQELKEFETLVAPQIAAHICWVKRVTSTAGHLNLYMQPGYEPKVRDAMSKVGNRVVLASNKDGSIVANEGDSIVVRGMVHDSCTGVVKRRGNKLGIEFDATNCSPGLGCNQAVEFIVTE